ncbi:choice-of-anchor I family protein [Plastoroseomonas arctica]|uniref:Bifunctional metallophosphatase/5'-nucleotidase n=1 Tax=Plastoroseomonas arctica TaxID=1509237 RepID=A0AAF1JVV0_9PROT|nr:choice-of-anchor I family protein [Plastoroseomonas arctica]MBR0653993.1 bifunctional metallophosphatase/5'-nucleotidase [Plastoroseomonas arctica]
MPGTDITATSIFTTNQSTITGGAAKGSEVNAFSSTLNRLFVLGGSGIDVVDPTTGAVVYAIGKADLGVGAATVGTGNSVAVNTTGGVTRIAVAFDGAPVTVASGTIPSNGVVAIFQVTASGFTLEHTIRPNESAASGPLSFAVPDMVTFTPDGSKVLVAIEGEPTVNYTHDPLGGVGIINVSTGAMQIAGFGGFDAATLNAAGVRVFGSAPTDLNGDGVADTGRTVTPFTATAAADLEPEYIAINAAGTKAYVTLQEANALAVLNIATGTFDRIQTFGLKDFSQADSYIDAADQNGAYFPTTSPVKGLYQPDGIATFTANGKTYLVTANEGDARDWGSFAEEVRVANAGLDTAVFPNAATLVSNANLGRLTVSAYTNNLDADVPLEKLEVFGSRSFSIWEYNDATGLTQVFDSGSALDSIIARDFPTLYDDGRADNKGAEPEGVTLGTIDGQLFAFVGLERYNAVLSFAIDTTGAKPTATYSSTIRATGDVAPEVFSFSADPGGSTGKLFVSNETSTTTSAFALDTVAEPTFTLQILHASDFEAGLQAVTRAPKFAAIIDKLEDSYANSITLASGDNYIPSPFFASEGDPALTPVLRAFYEQYFGLPSGSLSSLVTDLGRVDIAILNAIGIQASAFGNHEYDLGTRTILNAIDNTANAVGATTGAGRVTSIGAQFPYLSANLDFSSDPDLNSIFTAALRDASTYATTLADFASDAAVTAEAADQQISPWTVITENGEKIGVISLTTQLLATISSLGLVKVKDPFADGGTDNTAELAAIVQPLIDQMTTQGINKIILATHLQQYQLELDLATKLHGVDVILAGGSHAAFADATDGFPGAQNYPLFRTDLDGNSTAIVVTGNEYFDVGRLVITFDSNGHIIPGSVDANVSGAYVANDATVAALYGAGENPYADGTKGGEVKQLTDAVGAIIDAKLSVVAGYSDVYLQGQRAFVRTQETNFGDLSVDANIFKARQTDPNVLIGIKNGGGIREGIGVVGDGAIPTYEAPLDGKVTQLDIENALRFNNALSIVSFTAQGLTDLLENTLRGATPGATPGGFPHIGGLRFSFDATRAAGDRIVSLAVVDEAGNILDTLIQNAQLVGDANRTFRTVLLDFNINGPTGGDNFLGGNGGVTVTFTNRVDLTNVASGARTYTTEGSEQDALADYFAAKFATPGTAFDNPETVQQLDTRIQNLAFRTDGVFQAAAVNGTDAGDTLSGYGLDESFNTAGGNDLVAAGAGNDTILGGDGGDTLGGDDGNDRFTGGAGNDMIDGGDGTDTVVFTGTFASAQFDNSGTKLVVTGPEGTDTLRNVEQLVFADRTINLNDGDGLFDSLYYLRANLDVANSGLDPIVHYRQFGAKEGRDPNAFFDTSGYLAANKDVAASGLNPLEHFRLFGAKEQRDTSVDFDTGLYLKNNQDVASSGINALDHFLNFGRAEGRASYTAIGKATADGFDAEFYLLSNADVAAAGIDPREHFIRFGGKEGRDPNVLFDSSAYLANNADVKASGLDPMTHYNLFGFKEGRDPSAAFDTSAYLAANPDVAAAGINPLTHYLNFGVYEGRAIADQSALIA